jgi:hypothetical protein
VVTSGGGQRWSPGRAGRRRTSLDSPELEVGVDVSLILRVSWTLLSGVVALRSTCKGRRLMERQIDTLLVIFPWNRDPRLSSVLAGVLNELYSRCFNIG